MATKKLANAFTRRVKLKVGREAYVDNGMVEFDIEFQTMPPIVMESVLEYFHTDDIHAVHASLDRISLHRAISERISYAKS